MRVQRQNPAMRLAAIISSAIITLAIVAPAGAPASQAHPSLPEITHEVMCVTCKIPLDVAESPQANDERAFIVELINQGQNKTQIKKSLVAQYGTAVLDLPGTHGFDLTAYLVPLAVVLALLCALAVLLPSWRRHARQQAARGTPQSSPLSPSDAARLDADLARYDV